MGHRGWGPEVKSCSVSVVELHFYLSSGDVLLGAGMRKELLVMGSERGEELALCESKVVRARWQVTGRTQPERRDLLKVGINCLRHLSQEKSGVVRGKDCEWEASGDLKEDVGEGGSLLGRKGSQSWRFWFSQR